MLCQTVLSGAWVRSPVLRAGRQACCSGLAWQRPCPQKHAADKQTFCTAGCFDASPPYPSALAFVLSFRCLMMAAQPVSCIAVCETRELHSAAVLFYGWLIVNWWEVGRDRSRAMQECSIQTVLRSWKWWLWSIYEVLSPVAVTCSALYRQFRGSSCFQKSVISTRLHCVTWQKTWSLSFSLSLNGYVRLTCFGTLKDTAAGPPETSLTIYRYTRYRNKSDNKHKLMKCECNFGYVAIWRILTSCALMYVPYNTRAFQGITITLLCM